MKQRTHRRTAGSLVAAAAFSLVTLTGCTTKAEPPHKHTLHSGVVSTFTGRNGTAGFLELKLHDDKGDLELWIATDERVTKPFDLPLDTEIEVEFVDLGGRKVSLRVRDRDRNEDEAGNENVRDGKTHYFIYPSTEGEDASWLEGEEFSSAVIVRFSAFGERCESASFVLKPHTH